MLDEKGEYPEILDPKTTDSFWANGQKYIVDRSAGLSVARGRWLEKLTLYASLSRQPEEIITTLMKANDACHNNRLAEAAICIDNLLRGIRDMELKASPLYYVCTLFINREGEDRRKYSESEANAKIADWDAEGLDESFFLSVGLSLLTSSAAKFLAVTQEFSALGIKELPERSRASA